MPTSSELSVLLVTILCCFGCGVSSESPLEIVGSSAGTALCLNGDGSHVAFAGRIGTNEGASHQVSVIDTSTGKLSASADVVSYGIAWSESGRQLACIGPEGLTMANVWDRSVKSLDSAVANGSYGIAMHASGHVFVGRKLIAEWDGRTSCPQAYWFTSGVIRNRGSIPACTDSRSAFHFAVAKRSSPIVIAVSFDEDESVEVWELSADGESDFPLSPIARLPCYGPCKLALNAKGDRIAALSGRGLGVYSIQGGKAVRFIHRADIAAQGTSASEPLAISDDGRVIVAATQDNIYAIRNDTAWLTRRWPLTARAISVDGAGKRMGAIHSQTGRLLLYDLTWE